jgi:hypothetical protein
MAHAQKPDFVFRRNGRAHLNRQGRQFIRLSGRRGVRVSGSNAGYTMFRGSVKSTGYPLHSPVSTSLLLPCATVCHHVSTRLYKQVGKLEEATTALKCSVSKSAVTRETFVMFHILYYGLAELGVWPTLLLHVKCMCTNLITGMSRITKLRSKTDRIYDGGPIIM